MKRNAPESSQNRTAASSQQESATATKLELAGSEEDVRRLRPLVVLEHVAEASRPLTLAHLASQTFRGDSLAQFRCIHLAVLGPGCVKTHSSAYIDCIVMSGFGHEAIH